ncbi:MAG: GNAT family N-acetyltransferase, partial [Hyphomonadaceae bacterium]
ADAWRHLAAVVGHWSLKGFGQWAVVEKSTAEVIGCIGLWEPEGWPELEVGYWLVTTAHGKGYATEATIRARQFAYENLGATTLVSYIDPENEPSKRLAEGMGARHEQTIELLDLGPHCVYRHPSPNELKKGGA